MNNIKKIVIHVTAGDNDTVESINSDHKARGFSQIGYHDVIYKDGSVHAGRPRNLRGAHALANGGNIDSLGVSCVTRGNDFESDAPFGKYLTEEQKTSLINYCAENIIQYGLTTDDLYGHNDFDSGKACPCFIVRASKEFLEAVEARIEELKNSGTQATAQGEIQDPQPYEELAVKADPEDFVVLPIEEVNGNNFSNHINEDGLEFIKESEGLRLKSYQDSGGVWTIGYGTTIIDGIPVGADQEITKEDAEEYLKTDVHKFEKGVAELLDTQINENQFSACVSLAYNIGLGGFRGSSVRRCINDMDMPGAAKAFLLWDKIHHKYSQGLHNRRVKEKELFEKVVCPIMSAGTPD